MYYFVFLILLLCNAYDLNADQLSETKILVYTPAKCGTHLICKAVELMSGRSFIGSSTYRELVKRDEFIKTVEKNWNDGFITHTHWLPSFHILQTLKSEGYKIVSITRDPRDQLISYIYHFHKYNGYDENIYPNHPPVNKQLTKDLVVQLLKKFLINNIWAYKGTPFEQFYEPTKLQFLDDQFSCVVKFEDLVGSNGGGSFEKQIQSLEKINKHFNFYLDHSGIISVSNKLFGNSWSFRKGQIGEWRNYFDPSISLGFNKKFGTILYDLGYD